MAGMTQGMFMSGLRKRMLQEQQSQELRARQPEVYWGGATIIDPFSKEQSGDNKLDKAGLGSLFGRQQAPPAHIMYTPEEHQYKEHADKLRETGWSPTGQRSIQDAYGHLSNHVLMHTRSTNEDYHKMMIAGASRLRQQHQAAPHPGDGNTSGTFLGSKMAHHNTKLQDIASRQNKTDAMRERFKLRQPTTRPLPS